MIARVTLLACGGLFLGLLAPIAYTKSPSPVTPEVFQTKDAATAALPRLIKDLKSDDERTRAHAAATLGAMGATAKPAAPSLVEVAVNFRGHTEALKALAKIDDESTRKALRQLLVGGARRCKCGISFSDVVAAAGEPMVPHLLVLMREKELAENAAATLVQIGEPAVPHLVRTFDECCKAGVDPAVIRVLTQMGPKAKSATPALERQLATKNGTINIRIAQALIAANGSHLPAFNVIHDAFKGNDKALRTEALAAFFQLRANSPALIPSALNILADDDVQLYSSAMSILQNIGAPAVPPLIESLSKFDDKHSLHVLYTLSNLGPTASAAVPEFIKLLDGNDASRAILAARSLPGFGPEAKKAIPHLLAALKSDNFTLRRMSALSLHHIDREQTAHTIAPLIEVLRGKDENERMSAVYLLRTFGPLAKPAVPALVEMLQSEKLNERMSIVHAVHAIDANQIDAILPTLQEALQPTKQHSILPRQAVQIVGSIGPRAKNAAPALKVLLKESLKGEGHISPNQVILCMKKIGAMDEVMPIVIDALNSMNAEDREEAQYLVLDFLRDGALQPLEAALANGQLRDSPQVRRLMKDLRPKTAGAGK